MESKPERAANYLQFVDYALDAAKQNNELQDWPLKPQEEAYLCLPVDIYFKIVPEHDK